MADIHENDYVQFWIEENILYGFYKKDVILGLEAAKEVVDFRLKIQKGKSYNVIGNISLIKVVTPEARKYFSIEGYDGIEKLALISNAKFMNLMGNIFIQINKPVRPTKLFSSKEAAMKWLNEI